MICFPLVNSFWIRKNLERKKGRIPVPGIDIYNNKPYYCKPCANRNLRDLPIFCTRSASIEEYNASSASFMYHIA